MASEPSSDQRLSLSENETLTVSIYHDVELGSSPKDSNVVTAQVTDEVFHFAYESEPLFGTATEYEGYIVQAEYGLVVATRNQSPDNVAARIGKSPGFTKVTLTAAQQHELLRASESTIIEVNHPRHHHERIEDICLHSNTELDVEELRETIRENEHPIEKAHLRYDGEWVNVFFNPFNAGPPATPEGIEWLNELLSDSL